jgi:zinc protease
MTPDAPFRERMPEPGPAITFVAPKIESFTLKNGVRVLFVERHELPIVNVRFVVDAGAGDLPGEPPGVLSFVGAMLEQGTLSRSALVISDAYEAIGAVHSAWVDWDSGGAAVKVLASHLDEALDLLGDVVTRPSFPDAEIERLRARRLAAIAQEKNQPGTMWSNAAAASLFGRGHPYGHSLTGQEADVAKISRAELVRAYGALFGPKRAAVLVAGDVTRSVIEQGLARTFGSWRSVGVAPARAPSIPAKASAARVIFVDRPAAAQSVVRLAEVGVARGAPDRDAIVVMNTILGGMFSSRINLNLREAHAYTYGASSGFQMRHGAGHFSAGGGIVSDKTAPAVGELFKELAAIRDRPVLPEELADAREHIKLALPGRFETVTDVTNALADLFVYHLPLDEYATLSARLDRVTAADVQRAAKAHLHPAAIEVIVVGDRAKIGPEIDLMKLGSAEVRDAYGDLPTPAKP